MDTVERGDNKLLKGKIKYAEDIFDKLAEAVISTDPDFVITDWNKAAEKMYGWKKPEVVGKTLKDVLKPEYFGESRESVIDRFFQNKFYKGEAVCKRKDGSTVVVFSSFSMIMDNLGKDIGIVVITMNTTGQKEMQEELRRSEEKFRVAFHTSPDAVNINRLSDGKYVEINDGFAKLSGFNKNDIIGKTSLELDIWVNPKDRQILVEKLMKDGNVKNYEAQFRMKDGTIKTGIMSAHIIELNGEKHILSITRDVTEQKKIEKELIESEKLFKDLTEKSLVGVYLIMDGKFKYVNPKLAKIFGYRVKEVIDKLGPDDLTFYDDREKVLNNINRRVKGEVSSIRYSFRGLKKDGSIIYVEVHGSRTLIGGKPAVIGTLLDITKRKLIEDRLRKSENRYRELFEFSPVALWEEDFTQLNNYFEELKKRGVKNFNDYFNKNPLEIKKCAQLVNILDVNLAAVKLHEAKSKKEMLGELEFILTGDALENFRKVLIQLAEGKKRIRIESSIETPGSNIKYVLVNIFVSQIEENNKKLYRAFVSSSDITEIKLAEKSIIESETKFRNLAEYSPNMIFIFQDERIVFANRICENVMGYSREELYSPEFDFRILFDPEQIKWVLSNYQKYLDGERVEPSIYTLVTKSGEKIETIINTTTISYEGKPAVLGIITDITEQRKAEKRLRDSHDRIRNLAKKLQSIREEERAYIAREIHDDLGQSLTALKMDLSWILKKPEEYTTDKLSVKIAGMLSLIDSSIQNMKRIIYELRPSILDDLGLSPAIEWQSKEFERRTGINCSIVTDPNPVNLNADLATAVFRIFQETLTNIARHSNAKNVSGYVKFKGNKVSMKVVDDGVGITEEQLNNHYSFGILGMKERAEMWNGTVDIKGVKGKGTEVIVEIPFK